MIGDALLVFYIIVFFFVWRRAAFVIAWDGHYGSGKLKSDEVGEGIVIGFLVSLVWPITVSIYLASHHGNSFLRAPRHIRTKQKLEQQAERIQQLEREVGIR